MHEDQAAALTADGDGYHSRNYAGIGTIDDPAFDLLAMLHEIEPLTSILEVGCTTGFRLEKARTAFNAHCVGLEASAAAVDEGRRLYPAIDLAQGVAPRDLSQWGGQQFDVVILGHFTFILPRESLFELAARVDGLVRPGGHLIVMDFLYPHAMSAPYTHHDDLRVFKHDPSAPWLWSPTYALVSRQVYPLARNLSDGKNPQSWQNIDVLRKLRVDEAYPTAVTLPSVHDDEAPTE